MSRVLDHFPEVGKLVELCRKIYQHRRKYTANRERTYRTTKEEGKGQKTYAGRERLKIAKREHQYEENYEL